MNKVDELNEEIRRHEEAIAKLREKVRAIADNHIKTAIDNAASQQHVNVVSEHPRIVLVKSSQLMGNPWSLNFHDWRAGGELLVKWFEYKKIAPEKWYDTLKELYDNRKERNRIDLSIREKGWTTREPISAEFVKAVLDEMGKM